MPVIEATTIKQLFFFFFIKQINYVYDRFFQHLDMTDYTYMSFATTILSGNKTVTRLHKHLLYIMFKTQSIKHYFSTVAVNLCAWPAATGEGYSDNIFHLVFVSAADYCTDHHKCH